MEKHYFFDGSGSKLSLQASVMAFGAVGDGVAP